ncbi:MAG: iron-containing alcohol dehydrogenase [Aequoribacter sp.]|uniref:iron-containing alcohol dehydrogenase n=1 Tax=Aequoribacter sp. TaxID=2847771 RepID=UPI003C332B8C
MLSIRLKHALLMGLMKSLAGLGPGMSHLAFTGPGSSRQLCRYVLDQGYTKILVASDKILRELGVTETAVKELLEAGVEIAYFDDIEPNPTFEQVNAGKHVLKAAGSQVIIAVGGGSVIDCAKIMSGAATSDEDPKSWVGFGKVKHETIPLYAIPTTAGTGSEATAGAVITNVQDHAKVVISGASLLPKAAAVDPALQQGLPPAITAATGMDALTHAIEAYICTWDRGTRKEQARVAIKTIFQALPKIYADASDHDARGAMAMAAYHAGLAINQVNVGNVHAIAHQFGAYYGVPHGLANAVVLPYVLEFSKGPAEVALAELADLVGVGADSATQGARAQAFIDAVKALNTTLDIGTTLDAIKREDHAAIAQAAVLEAVSYPVPRLMMPADVLAMLEAMTV